MQAGTQWTKFYCIFKSRVQASAGTCTFITVTAMWTAAAINAAHRSSPASALLKIQWAWANQRNFNHRSELNNTIQRKRQAVQFFHTSSNLVQRDEAPMVPLLVSIVSLYLACYRFPALFLCFCWFTHLAFMSTEDGYWIGKVCLL